MITIRIAVIIGALISLPLLAHAASETRHYRGDMELVHVSGADCGDTIKQGDRIAINLAVRIWGENYDGYYAGRKTATGHFVGNRADKLSITFPGENPSAPEGHNLSLILSGDSLTGEVREKALAASEAGCNFDLARLVLVPEPAGSLADDVFEKLAKSFKAKHENRLGTSKFDEGNLPEAIEHFETELRLLEETEGAKSEALIEPLVVLSVAYCASDRFDKGKELQDRAFAIPMDRIKRTVWRVAVTQKLFVQQAKRLAKEGMAKKGIALLEKAVAAYPDLTGLYPHMAEMMIELGDPEGACISIEKAWSLDRKDPQLLEAQALCLVWKARATNDPDDAIPFLEQAWKLTPANLAIFLELNSAYATQGAPDTALSLIKENAETIIKEYGQKDYQQYQAVLYAAVSDIAASKQDYKVAEQDLRTALELDPVNTSYMLKLANVIHKSGRFEEAVRILDAWQKRCPDAGCVEQTGQAIEHENQLEKMVRKLNAKSDEEMSRL